MTELPFADRVSVSVQQRLSRALVNGGKRIRSTRRNGPVGPALQFTGRTLTSSGKQIGEHSRAQLKKAKKRADAARAAADGSGPVAAKSAKRPDLRALVANLHAAETKRVRKELARLAAGDHPVIVGPYVGEVGPELLHWVPFVKWALREFPRLHGRLIVVSRGGVRTWYGEGIRDYVDVLDVFSAEEFVERRKGLKQREPGALDLEVVSAVAERFGLREPQCLHPSLMWRGYFHAIKADELSYARAVHATAEGMTQPLFGLRSLYTPIAHPPLGELVDALPPDFVAARFYFNHPFPDTDDNRSFAAALLTALSERVPVVLLNNRLALDEHVDLDLDSPRIITLDDRMMPATNLHVQTVVLSRARAFVGTYGGLAYLGPHLGIPSLSFVQTGLEPKPYHLELAKRIFRGAPWGSLAVLSTRDLGVLELFVGSLSSAPA